MNKFAIAVAGALIGGLALQSVATAGATFAQPITVGTNIGYGSMKSARFSANTKEFIGCGVYGAINQGASTTYVTCSATDAAGRYVGCSTYAPAPQLVQAALAISATSQIIFQKDGASNCTYIYVNNNSANM